jgi:hypothetical protein
MNIRYDVTSYSTHLQIWLLSNDSCPSRHCPRVKFEEEEPWDKCCLESRNLQRIKDLTKWKEHLRGGENNYIVWRFLVPVWHFWVHLAPAQHPFDALHSLGIKMPPLQPPRQSKNCWTLKGELKNLWCHEIAGEHIGLRLHDASRQEHLHLPGGPWEAERSL